jgi:leucyl-tRNA synthetase
MRLFLLYVTPPEETSNWNEEGISGRVRLLGRIWRACEPHFDAIRESRHPELSAPPGAESKDEKALLRAVHVVAKSAIDETMSRRFHYNTTIAKLDELVNLMTASSEPTPVMFYAVRSLPILIAPFAPHIAEELWERLGHTTSVHLERYLEPEERALAIEEITLVVQVNGKVRARIAAAVGVSEDEALALALADPNVRAHLNGKELRKRIYVPDKLLNLVAA